MARIFVNLLSYTGLKGGTEKYTRELYRALGRLGTEHQYLGYASTEFMKLDHSWFPGKVIDSGISGENRWAWAYGELYAVGRAAKKHNAELVHSPANLGPRRTTMPAVYTMHDLLYFSLPEMMVKKSYNRPVQWMEKQAASNAARIITDSIASAQDIERFLGYDPELIDVIALAGTPPRRKTTSDQPRERDLFLAVGNRIPHKNWASLIRAIASLPTEQRPRLVVTGSKGDDPLRPLVDELGVDEWVDLRSWVPDEELAWLYDHATALMVPSFHDGFCLPALEAMHVGLPVLMSDIPVYREVGGESVGYFDPRDVHSIAASMRRAVDEPKWLATLTELGRERTREFTWERTARQTLVAFEHALHTER